MIDGFRFAGNYKLIRHAFRPQPYIRQKSLSNSARVLALTGV
jgi:hypothetical protein